MTQPEPESVDMRPLRPRLSSSALTLLDGALLGGLAVLAVPDRWEWLAALVIAVGVVVLAVRAWRIGLSLGPAGLDVRNYWRSRRFAWDDVEPNAYFDPIFMEQYQSQGQPIHSRVWARRRR